MNNRLFALAAALSVSSVGCAPQPLPVASAHFIIAGQIPKTWPKSPVAPTGAPPRIVRIWLSTLTIEPGSTLSGAIATSTNVASVEVRTAAFSINAVHVGPGQFRLRTRVLELPPLARLHSYVLDVIARNTAGVQQVEHALLAMR